MGEALVAAQDVPMNEKRIKDVKTAQEAIVKIYIGKCKDCVADKDTKTIEEELIPKIKDELNSESGAKQAAQVLGQIYKAQITECVKDGNMDMIENTILPKCEEFEIPKIAKEATKGLNTLMTKKLNVYIKGKFTGPIEDEFIPK